MTGAASDVGVTAELYQPRDVAMEKALYIQRRWRDFNGLG